MVAAGSLPGIGGVDPSSRLAFLEVLRRLVAVEAIAGTGGGGGGVTAHSALTGLTVGDDHPQYLNVARGDARYPLTTDARLSNARTPTAHVGTHSDIGTDPIIMGGDLTGGANSAVIGANKVTNAKLATVATSTIKGRATAGVGNVEDLTPAQVSTLMGLGTSSTLNVPASGNAAVGEVVKGSDTRLSDARTPSTHASTHSSAGADPISHNNLAGLTTGDPHTQYQLGSAKNAASGYAGLDATTKVAAAQIPTVTNAMLSTVNSATFKGRTTAGVGAPEDLTGTQATALLDVFTTALKGLVPSGGSASTFLRGDGTWQTIAGGGDMLKANNLSDVLSVATARTNLGLSSLATLVPPGTVGTVLRGNGTFAAPTIINVATGTPQALAAATDTYITGSALALASRQQVGTILRWRMSISKTGAGTATPIINLRWGTLGTVADAQRFTFTGVAQTGVVDSGWVDIEAVITTLNATTGQMAWSLKFGHNLQTTGFATIPMQSSALSSGTFDTTTANAIVGISMNSGTSAAWTMRAVYAEAFNLL